MVWLQAPIQAPPKPPVERVIRRGDRHRYSVQSTSTAQDTATYEYELELTVGSFDPPLLVAPVTAQLKKLKATIAGHRQEKDVFGSISAGMAKTGFLEGLSFLGPTLPFAIPMLSFYVPTEPVPEGKSIAVTSPLYDGAITAEGTVRSRPSREGTQQFVLDLNLRIKGQESDATKKRILRIVCTMDSRDGRLLEADGKLTAPDGTVSYRMRRLP